MKHVYLSIISSGFVIIGYLPEIYSTITENKNFPRAQFSSTLWLLAGIFGIIYSSLNKETFITANYSINTALNISILILKEYYKYKNGEKPIYFTLLKILTKQVDETPSDLPVTV